MVHTKRPQKKNRPKYWFLREKYLIRTALVINCVFVFFALFVAMRLTTQLHQGTPPGYNIQTDIPMGTKVFDKSHLQCFPVKMCNRPLPKPWLRIVQE